MGINTSLNCFDRLRDDLRDLLKRWDQRLRPWELSFADEYLNNRLAITLDFSWPTDVHNVTIRMHASNLHPVNDISSNYCMGSFKPSSNEQSQKHPVLVDIIELAKLPNGRCPSTIRLYVVNDEIANSFPYRSGNGSTLWFSVINGCFTSFPIIANGEIEIIDGRIGVQANDYSGPCVIERSSEIVDGISEHKIHILREALARLKFNFSEPDTGIELGDDFVRVISSILPDRALNIKNVLIGPFDLPPIMLGIN